MSTSMGASFAEPFPASLPQGRDRAVGAALRLTGAFAFFLAGARFATPRRFGGGAAGGDSSSSPSSYSSSSSPSSSSSSSST